MTNGGKLSRFLSRTAADQEQSRYDPPRQRLDINLHSEALETAFAIMTDRMAAIETKLQTILQEIKMSQSTEQTILADVQQLQAVVTGITDDLSKVQQLIADLQAQVAGGTVQQSTLDALSAAIKSVEDQKATLDNMATGGTGPTPPTP